MKERENYGTMEEATLLSTKKIRSCLGLLTLSIHKHVMLSVLMLWAPWALCLTGSHLKVLLDDLASDDGYYWAPRD
jgi:hypothetical protein